MEFALTKVYVKFYISQILNSVSYQTVKSNQEMLVQFIEENEDTNINISRSSNTARRETTYNDSKFRRLFMFNGVYYSKVEIMGIVVEMQTWGPDDKVRFIMYIDDGSGLISAIVWKNFNKNIFEKVQNSIVIFYLKKHPGKLIRVIGQVDHFNDSFEIVIENFEIVKSFKEQFIFNQKLQMNYKSISKSNLFDLHKITECPPTDNKNKNTAVLKKNFANRILAFFQNFRFIEERLKDGFIEVDIEIVFKNPEFMKMLEEYCKENNIQDLNKFFKECFIVLEKQSLGSIVDNKYIEIKSDNVKMKNEILRILRVNKFTGTSYINIFDHICKEFESFYCSDYVKFILKEMIDAGMIYDLGQNDYSILI
jgi:hypothetical protein